MAKADNSSEIIVLLILKLKTSLITRLLDNLTLVVVVNDKNKVNTCGGSEIIKKLAQFQKKIKICLTFKSLKIFIRYKKKFGLI